MNALQEAQALAGAQRQAQVEALRGAFLLDIADVHALGAQEFSIRIKGFMPPLETPQGLIENPRLGAWAYELVIRTLYPDQFLTEIIEPLGWRKWFVEPRLRVVIL